MDLVDYAVLVMQFEPIAEATTLKIFESRLTVKCWNISEGDFLPIPDPI